MAQPVQPVIRVGIVGAGEVAQTIHLPTLQLLAHKYKVTALSDVSRLSLEHCGTKFGLSSDHLHENSLDLVKRADVDLVVILSADEYHTPLTVQAADAGKHVLIEKPMALTNEDADAIIAAQKRNNVVIFIGYMRRYAPAFLEAVKIVRNMKTIDYARVRDIIGRNKIFVDQSGTSPRRFDDFPADFSDDLVRRAQAISDAALGAQRAKDPNSVFTYRFLGGLGSHDLSAMRELLGPPKRCIGAGKNSDGMFITALFEYDGFVTTYETGIDNVGKFDAHLEVHGDGKRVKVTYDTPFVKGLPITLTILENNSDGHYQERIVRPTYQDAYTCEYEALYDSIVHGSPVKTTPEDAKEDLKIFKQVIDALYPLVG
ncbi:NAD-P-binding protein [Rhizoctonia solani]|nr:NAD-P-binding protein [Rhizoctonia solani]